MGDGVRAPSRVACLEYLKQHNVPAHIIAHSLQVERVACYLAQVLNQEGEDLDLRLVKAAALLHDIAKMDALGTDRNHADAGGDVLRRLGYPRVAEVVEHHIVAPHELDLVKVTEDGLVNYADKRVLHDRIVTLDDRFDDLKKRYGKTPASQALIYASLERVKEIERKIFRKLSMRPEELTGLLEMGNSQ